MQKADHTAPREEIWLTEALQQGFSYSIRSEGLLYKTRSLYQDIEVHESADFGRLLLLDGSFMTSEKDEFFYHENLVHVAACAHDFPQSALIIGGGDGGSAKELAKYASIRNITLVEIDAGVLEAARKYLPAIHHGVIDTEEGDPRVHVVMEDGLQFVRESTEEYDLLILDLTDPRGPSQPLYTADFYVKCATRLKRGGILSLHIASPFVQQQRMINTLAELRKAFNIVRPYLVSLPLSGGPWMMACASGSVDPAMLPAKEAEARLASRGVTGLRYYNGHMHQAAMALPNYIRSAVASSGACTD